MKSELLQYASFTHLYKQKSKKNRSFLFSDLLMGICTSVMLSISSIPMLITKFWIWVLFFVSLILILLYRKRETDEYSRAILIDGAYLVYASIFLSFVFTQYNKTLGSSVTLPLIITTLIYLITYECIVLNKIIRKKYSQKKETVKYDNKKDSKTNPTIAILSTAGAITGVLLSRLTSGLIPYSISQVTLVATIGLLWLLGFILIQKYIIYKILKNKV